LSSPDAAAPEEPIRLLIADDDEATRGLLRDELSARGFEVVATVADGLEAFQRAPIVRPEVVLMDVRMPELDGVHATAMIKAQMPRTQIVILTAFAQRDTRWEAELMGAASLVDKDTSMDELAETLRAAGLAYRSFLG
jgi:DNA-binding NarL/FixJ family response regulator